MNDIDDTVDFGGAEGFNGLSADSGAIIDSTGTLMPNETDNDVMLSGGDVDVVGLQLSLESDANGSSAAMIPASLQGDTSHKISFGARLDKDAYNELMKQRDSADWTLKTTNNDAEFLDAYKRKEEAQKAMDKMKFNSDEYKYYEESEIGRFNAIVGRINNSLSRLRANGINVPTIPQV